SGPAARIVGEALVGAAIANLPPPSSLPGPERVSPPAVEDVPPEVGPVANPPLGLDGVNVGAPAPTSSYGDGGFCASSPSESASVCFESARRYCSDAPRSGATGFGLLGSMPSQLAKPSADGGPVGSGSAMLLMCLHGGACSPSDRSSCGGLRRVL